MRFLIQRVLSGDVKINQKTVGSIDKGYVVFVGICDSDNQLIADKMLQKLLNLRIFEDAEGKTNLSLMDVGGEILFVSQFTLYADCRKGNRPSFINAGKPQHAKALYEYLIDSCTKECPGIRIQQGEFGADMKVSLTNDGPFTIWLDSDTIIR